MEPLPYKMFVIIKPKAWIFQYKKFIIQNRMSNLMNLPKRKPTRLKDFDYSSPGAYFVTIAWQELSEPAWKTVF